MSPGHQASKSTLRQRGGRRPVHRAHARGGQDEDGQRGGGKDNRLHDCGPVPQVRTIRIKPFFTHIILTPASFMHADSNWATDSTSSRESCQARLPKAGASSIAISIMLAKYVISSTDQLAAIRTQSLAAVICRNTAIHSLQPWIFSPANDTSYDMSVYACGSPI